MAVKSTLVGVEVGWRWRTRPERGQGPTGVQRKVHKLAWPDAKRHLKTIAHIARAWGDLGHIHGEHQGVIAGLGRSLGQRQTRVDRPTHVQLKPSQPATVFEHALQGA